MNAFYILNVVTVGMMMAAVTTLGMIAAKTLANKGFSAS